MKAVVFKASIIPAKIFGKICTVPAFVSFFVSRIII